MLKEYKAPSIEIIEVLDVVSASGDTVVDSGSFGFVDGGMLG